MPAHGNGLDTASAHAPKPQNPRWIEIGRLFRTLTVAAGATLVLLLVGSVPGDTGPAQGSESTTIPDEEDPGTGVLCVIDPHGGSAKAFPLRHTEVEARVAGQVAQVTVEQRFENPFDRPIEAVYVFPLPHEAAVNDFEMHIGERRIRGEIHERGRARRIYEQARQRGQVAALLDQERPNIFTQSIANIMPGSEIVVRLRYVESLAYDERGYAFVFPTVVGPRYIPGQPLRDEVLPAGSDGESWRRRRGTGWSPDTDRVPDASRITPPVLLPGERSGHDIGITVHIEAGVPLGSLRCESHAVNLQRRGATAARIALRPSDTIPNKDFVLRWKVGDRVPQFGLLTYRDPARAPEGVFALHFQPQQEWGPEEARPKEMIFLLDTSGSMRGEPLAKVKSAIRWALQNLNPQDRFQIVRFSNQASAFARSPLPGTPENVSRALEYLETLRGGGGTEMRAGIEAALCAPAQHGHLRLVFFMTDGYIGNDTEVLATVRRHLGDARIFAFGVGSSVNHLLLHRIAEEGRGCVDTVMLHEDTRDVVERFYGRVARPYLTDIRLTWSGLEVQDLEPRPLPDLFAGQPLVLTGRYTQPGKGTLVVEGILGQERFRRRIPVTLPERAVEDEALAVLWARKRIARASASMIDGNGGDLRREITALALQYRLVSAYTSFVAVDNQVVNEAGDAVLVAQPVPLPEGVQYEGVFGKSEEVQAGVPRRQAFASVMAPSAQPGETGLLRSIGKAASGFEAETRRALPLQDVEGSGKVPPLEAALTGDVGSVELEAKAVSPTFARGEGIEIRVTLHNRGSDPLQVPSRLAAEAGTLWVMVNGKPLVMGREKPGTSPLESVAPGSSHTWTVRLDPAYFPITGSYQLILHIPLQGQELSFASCAFEVR